MRTPKEYTQNLKQKIITKQMLADCLYSVNKRAKNCRDNEHKYSKYRTDYYGNADNYRQQKEEYYSQKDKMLTLLKPNCIHETTEYHKERVYDYRKELVKWFEKIGVKLRRAGINTLNGALQDYYGNKYKFRFRDCVLDENGKPTKKKLTDNRRILEDGTSNPNRNKKYWILEESSYKN